MIAMTHLSSGIGAAM